jgi:hypothetical protein
MLVIDMGIAAGGKNQLGHVSPGSRITLLVPSIWLFAGVGTVAGLRIQNFTVASELVL